MSSNDDGGGAPRLILASASPGRRRVLAAAGIDFEPIVSEVDEDAVLEAAQEATGPLSPAQSAELLARTKAEEVASRGSASGGLVLGCDSVFELDGQAYGKPHRAETAVERWLSMRGRTGTLHTGHWLVEAGSAGSTTSYSWFGTPGVPGESAAGGDPVPGVPTHELASAGRTVSTEVRFAEPDEEQIRAYAASGEPLHCAGAFTIDGRGAAFVRGVEGDHLSVIGVSPHALGQLMGELGRSITEVWNPSPSSQSHNPPPDAGGAR